MYKRLAVVMGACSIAVAIVIVLALALDGDGNGGKVEVEAEAANVAGIPAGIADHIVISEICGDNDGPFDFIELYNPTGSSVDLSGWSIQYKPAKSVFDNVQKKNLSGAIASHGFYLIAASDSALTPDDAWAQGFAQGDGNAFLASNQEKVTDADDPDIVDKVAYGNGDSPETLPAQSPAAGQSVERKTDATGIDHSYGNAWDTDDNSMDFLVQTPNPQNSGSGPVSPLPELSTLALFSIGLVGIASVAVFKRRRVMVFSQSRR